MADLLRVSKRTIYRALKEERIEQALVRGRTVIKVPIELQSMQHRGDRLLKPNEVAEILQCSRTSVYRWFNEDELSGLMLWGETLRLYESGVEAFIEIREYNKEINV